MSEKNCWKVLGIEPTSDEKAIKKSYAIQLKDNRPDKNKDGFLVLRAAYEKALETRFWINDQYDNSDDVTSSNSGYTESDYKKSDYDEFEEDEYETDNYIQEDEHEVEETDSPIQEDEDETPIVKPQHLNIINEVSNITDIPEWETAWNQTMHESDEAFNDCLKDQFATLNELSLDAMHEFESELIDWFDDINSLLPKSFEFASKHFKWEKRLSSWEAGQHPWSIVQNLVDIYQYANLDKKEVFQEYLSSDYPNIHAYCLSRDKLEKTISSISLLGRTVLNVLLSIIYPLHFFIEFCNPFGVYELAGESKQLENELENVDNISNGKIQVTQWKILPELIFINESIFGGTKLVNKKSLWLWGIIWAPITALLGTYYFLTPPLNNFHVYFFDFLGVLLVITLFLTIRRLIINQLIDESKYVITSASKSFAFLFVICVTIAVFFYNMSNIQQSITVNNENVGMVRMFNQLFSDDTQVNYFLANVSGLVASVILSFFLHTRFKLPYWNYIIITTMFTMIIPVVKSLNHLPFEPKYSSPLLWLLIGLPFLMIILGMKFSWLSFLINLGALLIIFLPMYAGVGLLAIIIMSLDDFQSWGYLFTGLCIATSFATLTYYTVSCVNSMDE